MGHWRTNESRNKWGGFAVNLVNLHAIAQIRQLVLADLFGTISVCSVSCFSLLCAVMRARGLRAVGSEHQRRLVLFVRRDCVEKIVRGGAQSRHVDVC